MASFASFIAQGDQVMDRLYGSMLTPPEAVAKAKTMIDMAVGSESPAQAGRYLTYAADLVAAARQAATAAPANDPDDFDPPPAVSGAVPHIQQEIAA